MRWHLQPVIANELETVHRNKKTEKLTFVLKVARIKTQAAWIAETNK